MLDEHMMRMRWKPVDAQNDLSNRPKSPEMHSQIEIEIDAA